MAFRVIVCGGGIGGLTTALALRRSGIEATVFERAPRQASSELAGLDQPGAPRSTGSGLTLWSNATRVLEKLGLLDQILSAGSVVESFENRTSRGRRIAAWPIAEMARSAHGPSVNISRADLHRILRDAVDGQVVDGAEFAALDESGGRVTAQFTDGRRERGDVLVGADGLRSQVRSCLRPTPLPRFAGYAVYRAIVGVAVDLAPPGLFVQMWGRGARFGFYQVGGGRTYWFAVTNCGANDRDLPSGRKATLHQRFAGWAQPVGELLEASDDNGISRARIFDRDPTRIWGSGRVTLLGDAIHPMTFNVGQGACQAVEDAAALSRELRDAEDPTAALRRYETGRMDRTQRLVLLARRIGNLGRWEAPGACAARDLLLRPLLSGPARRQHERVLRSS